MHRLSVVLLLAVACASPESSDRLPEGSPQLHVQLYGTRVEGVTSVVLPLAGLDTYLVDEPGEATSEPGQVSGGRWFPLPAEGGATLTDFVEETRPWEQGVRKVPVSRISQFRLRFRENGKIRVQKADGSECAIDPASVDSSAWLISSPFRARPVAPGETWQYRLRLDLAKSLHPDGKGCFTLEPSFVVTRILANGAEKSLR